jgi:hypothetical protein
MSNMAPDTYGEPWRVYRRSPPTLNGTASRRKRPEREPEIRNGESEMRIDGLWREWEIDAASWDTENRLNARHIHGSHRSATPSPSLQTTLARTVYRTTPP